MACSILATWPKAFSRPLYVVTILTSLCVVYYVTHGKRREREKGITNAANFSDTVSNCPISDAEEVKRKTFLTAVSRAHGAKRKLAVILWKWDRRGYSVQGARNTKRQNELYSEVWKLFSQSSTDVPALLPFAVLPRQAKGS